MTYKLTIIVGSLRKDSLNLKLAKALANLGKNNFTPTFARIDDLPLFNEDLESNPPAPVTRLKSEIESADAVLFVTPEYNRSFPGVLKNALDWASRPYGKNSFNGKPTGLSGTSMGSIGSALAQNQLKPVLSYLNVKLMGQPEAYIQFKPDMVDNDGNINNPDTLKYLQSYMDKLALWVKTEGELAQKAA